MTAATHDEHGLPLNAGRVRLRRLHASDLDIFAAYRGDAGLGRWQGWTPMSRGQALAFLDEMQGAPAFAVGAWFQVAIADAGDDRLLGDLGVLLHDADTAEIGFTLAREAQHRGLAREAVAALVALLFERTAVQRVRAVTDARNAASAKLMAGLGWQQVATESTVFRGAPCIEWTFETQRVLRHPDG